MAYIGRPATSDSVVVGSTDTFTGNGGVSFTLSRSVKNNNPSLLEVFVSNVQQQPTVTYSVVGNVLTFTTAPGVGESIYVTYRDYDVAPLFSIADGAVTTGKITAGAVTEAKIADSSITEGKIAANAVTETKISGIIPVTKGGTGRSSLAANSVLGGNGTGSVSLIEAGPTNNVLLSTGTTWVSRSLFGTINTPTVTITGGPTNVLAAPNITTSVFNQSSNILTDTHVSTDYQIIRTSNSQIVFDRVADTANLLTVFVPSGILEANTQYEFRAKHNSFRSGNSAFGSNTSTTQVVFTIPTFLGQSIGGGFYTGTVDIGSSTCYYLIVAPNATGCACCQWKTTRTSTAGVDSGVAGVNGYNNTFTGLNNAGHPAGNWTATRTIGGFSDWYLPAGGELSILHTNRNVLPSGEGYASNFYWASSQYQFNPTPQAEGLNMVTGFRSGGYKTNTERLRAVRRVPFL